jgi:hypothetical protein
MNINGRLRWWLCLMVQLNNQQRRRDNWVWLNFQERCPSTQDSHSIPLGLNPSLPCKRVCILLPDNGTLQQVQAWDPIVHPRSMQLKDGESQCSFEFNPVCYCTCPWGLVGNDSEFWLLNRTDCWFVSLLKSGIEANHHSSHTTAFWYTSCTLFYFSTYCWSSVYQS